AGLAFGAFFSLAFLGAGFTSAAVDVSPGVAAFFGRPRLRGAVASAAAGAATLADFALLGFLPGVFLAVVLAGFSFLLTAGASLFGLRPRFLPVAFLLVVIVGLVVVSAFTASLAWARSALASAKASFSSAPAVRNFANSAWAFLTRLCVAADFLFLLA